MKKRIFYYLLTAAFLIIIFFQDNHSFISPQLYLNYLKSDILIENSDIFNSISINTTIILTIVAISIAMIGLTFSKSQITFSSFMKHITPTYHLKLIIIIISINFIITIFSTYFRYSFALDLWFKLSIIPSLDFLYNSIRCSIFLENIQIMMNRFEKLIIKDKHKDAVELFFDIINVSYPNIAYEQVLEVFNNLIVNEKSNDALKTHNLITERWKNAKS